MEIKAVENADRLATRDQGGKGDTLRSVRVGYFDVYTDGSGLVVISHPLLAAEAGVVNMGISQERARALGRLLLRKADEAHGERPEYVPSKNSTPGRQSKKDSK